jgi:hypothetical protein
MRCACNPRRGDGPIAGAYPTLVHIWSAAVSLLMTIFGFMRLVFFVWLANGIFGGATPARRRSVPLERLVRRSHAHALVASDEFDSQ